MRHWSLRRTRLAGFEGLEEEIAIAFGVERRVEAHVVHGFDGEGVGQDVERKKPASPVAVAAARAVFFAGGTGEFPVIQIRISPNAAWPGVRFLIHA
jgi:hypothetical protein